MIDHKDRCTTVEKQIPGIAI